MAVPSCFQLGALSLQDVLIPLQKHSGREELSEGQRSGRWGLFGGYSSVLRQKAEGSLSLRSHLEAALPTECVVCIENGSLHLSTYCVSGTVLRNTVQDLQV